MGNTQALPGVAVTGDAAAAPEQHEVIYQRALRRIAALDETWQEAVRGVGVSAGSAAPEEPPAAAAAAVAVPVVPAPVPAPAVAPARLGPAAVPALPALPRAPVTATAEITAIAADGPEEAVLARAAAPRWRRSLAS
jgi:hypothetical protein